MKNLEKHIKKRARLGLFPYVTMVQGIPYKEAKLTVPETAKGRVDNLDGSGVFSTEYYNFMVQLFANQIVRNRKKIK